MKEISSLQNENIGIYGIQERNYYLQSKIESEGYLLFDDFSTSEKPFNILRTNKGEFMTSPLKFVDFVPGSFILIKRDVFEKCGLLDEAFFMYSEEAEFCFRAWNSGFSIIVNPDHYYLHKVAASAGNASPFSLYYRVRNNFYFLQKHRKRIQFYFFYLTRYSIAIFYSYLKISASLLINPKKKLKLWKAFGKALIDAGEHKYYQRF